MSSFETQGANRISEFSFAAWKVAFSDPVMTSAIWNTITITLARQAIALPIAILLAWIIARTDIPAATSSSFYFGWVIFCRSPGHHGMDSIVRSAVRPDQSRGSWVLPFIKEAPFNIYSFWGIVWAHLTTSTIAVEVMLFTPAFRNMDATLEEASWSPEQESCSR